MPSCVFLEESAELRSAKVVGGLVEVESVDGLASRFLNAVEAALDASGRNGDKVPRVGEIDPAAHVGGTLALLVDGRGLQAWEDGVGQCQRRSECDE
jgi:hypothetical protein